MSRWIIVGALAGSLGSWLAFAGMACGHATPIVKAVQPACEELTTKYGRPDLADVCRFFGSMAPVIDILVGEAKAGQCK